MNFVLSNVSIGAQKGRIAVAQGNRDGEDIVELSLRYYLDDSLTNYGDDEPASVYTAHLNAKQARAVAKALLLIAED